MKLFSENSSTSAGPIRLTGGTSVPAVISNGAVKIIDPSLKGKYGQK